MMVIITEAILLVIAIYIYKNNNGEYYICVFRFYIYDYDCVSCYDGIVIC